MRVLLVEPYYDGSHRAWADGYAASSRHEVRVVGHSGSWWKWRMRGAAVTLAASLEGLGTWRPDVVMVSDMIDLAHFRLFARPHIGDRPVALYFHESQFTYPQRPGDVPDQSYALTNWVSALAADGVVFNSDYHREVFFSSLPGFLRQFPDQHHTGRISALEARADVLPVGVNLSWVDDRESSNPTKRILWNHRWEKRSLGRHPSPATTTSRCST